MGYQIYYGGRFAAEMVKTVVTDKKRRNSLFWLYAVTALLVLAVVYTRYGTLLPVFLPGGISIVDYIKDMAGGAGLAEALSNFCRAVLEAAV